ncbi:MAG: hypothetical protein ACI8XB_000293 [Patiriisocius sp.]
MHILGHYLKLKLKLLYRSLGQYKVLWSFIICALAVFTAVKLYQLQDISNTNLIAAISVLTVMLIQYHINRKDKDFLKSMIGKQSLKRFLSLEYLILCTPIILLIIIKGFLLGFFLLFVPIFVAFLPSSTLFTGNKISVLGKGNLEWNAGFRTYLLIHLTLFILFILSCIYKANITLSLVLMAVTLLSFSTYYSITEDEQSIIVYRNAKELMISKIRFMIIYTLIFGILLMMILLLSHGIFSWFAPMIVIQVLILLFTSITVKYGYYPNKMAGELQMSILFLMGLIPFLAPVTLLIAIHFYKKSINRLNPYFT